MIITISGIPGSGKSTVGKIIAQKLGYKFLSMGDMRGAIALKHNMTIDELNKIGEKENWTDKQVDDYQRELGQKENNLVVEGRVSFHFIPNSFKVFLNVDTPEAARRALENRAERTDEKLPDTIEETEKQLVERLKSDQNRYQKHYQIDYLAPSNFDLFLNTTNLSIQEVVDIILDKIKALR
ncbi:MAG: (d)CMP kinase [Candidatus Magasanikbacteria bacterium]|nr:(d)CMP kinase [Candidatus Magasanikbacteria bacterium]